MHRVKLRPTCWNSVYLFGPFTVLAMPPATGISRYARGICAHFRGHLHALSRGSFPSRIITLWNLRKRDSKTEFYSLRRDAFCMIDVSFSRPNFNGNETRESIQPACKPLNDWAYLHNDLLRVIDMILFSYYINQFCFF